MYPAAATAAAHELCSARTAINQPKHDQCRTDAVARRVVQLIGHTHPELSEHISTPAPDHRPDDGSDDVVGAANDGGRELALSAGDGRLPWVPKHLRGQRARCGQKFSSAVKGTKQQA